LSFNFKHGGTIGRYRPYHNGHFFLHKKMLKDCAKITILIGSSQEEDTYKNPFTIEEVKDMILGSLSKHRSRITIKAIPDINNPSAWADYVIGNMGDSVDAYYAGSEEDILLFKHRTDLNLLVIDRTISSQKNNFKSGTEIRELMYSNN